MAQAHIEGAKMGTEFAKALAKFQADLPAVDLDGTNPHFKSKYATLANVTKIVLPKLSENGFSFVTGSHVEDGVLILDAKLLHESGEFETASFPITETQPQKVGSAVTYYRRYALASLTGVVADADDDGNAASQQPPAAVRSAQARPATKPAVAKAGSAKDKVRLDWIEAGKADKDSVNGLVAAVKAAEPKLKGDEVFAAVLKRLEAGEVG